MAGQHPYFDAALAAVDCGDSEELADLLRRHPDLAHARAASDEPPYDGYFWRATLLHHVAGNPTRYELPGNVVEIAQVLLAAGAEVDAGCGGGPSQPETGGGTTLGLVASGSQAYLQGVTGALLDCLLDAGATLDSAGDGGVMWIAFYHTVENRGQREVAQMLFERGHPVDLCFAAGLGKLDLVKRFIRADGSLDPEADRFYRHHRSSGPEATERGILEDALLFAAICNQRDVAELLLAKGVDVNALRGWGPEGVTPLHGAAWAGWPEMAEWLLARGADIHRRDEHHEGTPIGWAAYCGRRDVLDLFLADESSLDLLDAFEFGSTERFAELLGDGDPDLAVGAAGRGALLRHAAFEGRRDMVELLLARGADPSLTNPEDKTALDAAYAGGQADIAALLHGEEKPGSTVRE